MSYNISRQVSPEIAILSFSSVASGNVTFAIVNGQFSPSIDTTTISLDSGFEYFITSSPVISSAAAATFYHIVDGVNKTSYAISATALTSGLDQQIESIQADALSTFALFCSQATDSNSRLEIWRIPL